MTLPLSITSFPKTIVPKFPYSTGFSSSNGHLPCQVRSTAKTQDITQEITRRSGNWTSPLSDFDFFQSLASEYVGEPQIGRANKLKADVRIMLRKELNFYDQLELIDILQRIGLAYHFEDEIELTLEKIFNNIYRQETAELEENLCTTALAFRLLRNNGHILPQEVFNGFKDEKGDFMASLGGDMEGMLNLYEASYHLVEGESILEDAREFAAKHLKEYHENHSKDDQYLSMLVSHALELPLHWRMQRMEARWLIDVYEKRKDYCPTILELAKLDFNIVQAQHQDEVRGLSRWWNDLDLGEKLFYTRERIMENVFFSVGEKFEPQFGYFRKIKSRVNALITTLDDAYDVYGTLDEAEILTQIVNGWDANELERLPDILKISFLALFNTINDIAYFILKERGINAIPCLKKLWGDLCGAYLQEAKWFHSGYTPTLEEYLENGWLSSSAHVLLGHSFLLASNPLTPEMVKCYMDEYPSAVRFSSIILRLANDLATSSDEIARGDVPKSIQCYMHETGATEEEAREHIKGMIYETWKKLNKERFAPTPFSQTFIDITLNLARAVQCCYDYEHGDGYGIQDDETKNRLYYPLFVHPLK